MAEEESFEMFTDHGAPKQHLLTDNHSWMHNAILNFLRLFFIAIVFFYICKWPLEKLVVTLCTGM